MSCSRRQSILAPFAIRCFNKVYCDRSSTSNDQARHNRWLAHQVIRTKQEYSTAVDTSCEEPRPREAAQGRFRLQWQMPSCRSPRQDQRLGFAGGLTLGFHLPCCRTVSERDAPSTRSAANFMSVAPGHLHSPRVISRAGGGSWVNTNRPGQVCVDGAATVFEGLPLVPVAARTAIVYRRRVRQIRSWLP